MSALIPGYTVFERGDLPLPTEGWNDGVVTRHVHRLLDGKRAVDEVVAALPFGRYKVYVALRELLESGCIRAGIATEAGQRAERRRQLLGEVSEAEREGRWGEAIQILEGLVARYPNDDEVVPALVRALEGFRLYVHGHNFGLEDVPVVTIGDAASRLPLDPHSGFVLSRVDGTLTVRQILKISPVKEVDGLRILKRLHDAKVIDFPRRR
jgi:hypothetical protein